MKRIGIDIDGCLTDVYNWYLKNGLDYAKSIDKNLVNEKGYDAMEMYNLTKEEFKDFLDKKLLDYSLNEPARKNASKVCKKLIDSGFELYIITARFNSDRTDEEGLKMRKIVESWFERNDIPYTKIIYSSEDKLDICLDNNTDVMIEDKSSTLLDIKNHLPVICFDAPYNRDIDDTNLYRVRDWLEIGNLIFNNKISFQSYKK